MAGSISKLDVRQSVYHTAMPTFGTAANAQLDSILSAINGNAVTLTGTQALTNKTISDALTFAQISTPSNPAANQAKFYTKSDGYFYELSSAGVETRIGAGQGGGSVNFVANPNADANTNNWLAQNVTASRDVTSGHQFDGTSSFALTAATNPAAFTSDAMTLYDGVTGNCQYGMTYEGDATKWMLQLLGPDVLTTTGTYVSSTCMSVGASTNVVAGDTIFDLTNPSYVGAQTTVVGIGTGGCGAGQIQTSAAISASMSGDSIRFSGAVINQYAISGATALTNASTPQTVAQNYPCTQGARLQLVSTASSPANINVGQLYWGAATNLQNVSQAHFFGSVVTPGTSGCVFSANSTTYISFPAQSACPVATPYGNASAPATKIPAITFPIAPAGDYYVVANADFNGSIPDHGSNFRFTDGTNYTPGVQLYNGSAYANASILSGHFTYTSAQSNLTFQLQGASDSGSATIVNNGTAPLTGFEIIVYYFPTSSQLAVTPSTSPASWSGTLTGGMWTYVGTSPGDFAASAGTVTPSTAGSPINITCAQTAGNLPSITCSVPKAGMYGICQTSNGYTAIAASFGVQMTDGANAIIAPVFYAYGSGASNTSVMSCGDYTTASTSLTIKLRGAVGSSSIQEALISTFFQITDKTQNVPVPVILPSIAASYRLASPQVFSSSTPTTVVWNSAILDTDGGMNTGTGLYTVPAAGTYEVITTNSMFYSSGVVVVSNGGWQGILKNGSIVAQQNMTDIQMPAGITQFGGATYLGAFAKGDTIGVQINQVSGGAYSVNGGATGGGFVSIKRIGN